MTGISILFVIDGLEFGGGERVFLQLAAGLKDRYQVFIAATPAREFEKRIKKLNIPFFPVDMSRRTSLKPISQIKNIIKTHKIDVVHSQGARADFFARLASRSVGLSHILCTVAMPVEGFDIGIIRKKAYRFMDYVSQRYVEHFIVVSDSLKQFLIEMKGIPAKQITKIHNGIELDQYNPDAEFCDLRKEFEMPSNDPLIGAIGRMVWQKGFEYLIHSLPEIIDINPGAKILFVGEGPLKNDLRKLAEDLNVIDNVIFTGFRNDMQSILSSLDILVVPSLLEGFPMVILEGMAMAKPIIAASLPGILEQIESDKTGIIVPPKNSSAISSSIIDLLKNKNKAFRLGRKAREFVLENFTVQKMICKTEQVYQELLPRFY
jgi:glycosyltransferase involved in cell wall biosynthesis